MATVDTETVLTKARLADDVTATILAIIEGDMEEARFRLTLIRSQAGDLGLDAVARAAIMVVVLLPKESHLPKRGIGRAMLRLRHALEVGQ